MTLAAYFPVLCEAAYSGHMHPEEVDCCKRLMGRIARHIA
jgi:hypothetical protein